MKKNNKNRGSNNKIFLSVIAGVSLLVLFFILSFRNSPIPQSRKPETTTTIPQKKTYYSKTMKISVDIPNSFDIEEKFGRITLKKKNKTSEIIIGSIGTNYANLEDYFNYHVTINKQNLIERQSIMINNLNSIKAVIGNPIINNPDYHSYFFYSEPWTIISLSTNRSDLYFDLDQIARSFHYTP